MSAEPIFSRRVLTGWIAAAAVLLAGSLFFVTRGDGSSEGHEAIGPNTFSRSAIGHAGFAEILRQLGVPVVKSQFNSPQKLVPGSVLVIAEPWPMLQPVETFRPLLDAKIVLLILPKRTGTASENHPEWLGKAAVLPDTVAAAVLDLAVPKGDILRPATIGDWTKNDLGPVPSLVAPIQLMRSDRLRPVVANTEGVLVGAIDSPGHRLWVLSDPDVIANHGIARADNAAFAVALIEGLRGADGRVVFDETVHGFVTEPASPLRLLFKFPYVFATLQGAIALGLLLWATIARFGAPQPMTPPLRAGKHGLIENTARLLEFAGYQSSIVRRYVEATIRDVAQQIHAPRGLAERPLLEWLRRIGDAREVATDCTDIYRRAGDQADMQRGDLAPLVPIARDIYRWKGEMLDGTAGHSRQR